MRRIGLITSLGLVLASSMAFAGNEKKRESETISVPEINASAMVNALALLSGGVLVLQSKRKK